MSPTGASDTATWLGYPASAPVVPDQLTVLTTSSCTARCAHCLVRSGPERADTLRYQQIVDAVDAAHAASRLAVVVFAGGEPTMLGEHLLDAIAHVNGLGIGTRLVTNASWAADECGAADMVRRLREAGLDEINFSADDFHLPFIPLECVVNAWRACKGVGFRSVVIALSSGPGSKVTPELVQEMIGERVPLTYDDRGDLRTMPPASPDGTTYLIANNNVYRIGRGRRLRERYVSYPATQEHLERPCPWAVRSAALSPKNHLVACCGIEAEHNDVLDFGAVGESSIVELVQRANADPLVAAIAELGPRYLMRRAQRLDPNLRFRPRYSAICEICEDVTTNPRAVALLRAASPAIEADVLAARILHGMGFVAPVEAGQLPTSQPTGADPKWAPA